MKLISLILSLLLTLPVWAAEEAGEVVFVAGTVNAERSAAAVGLKKTDSVYEQDVIVTAARSRGQLLMRDGAKYALRPETRFVVIEYFMVGDERIQPDGSVVIASNDGAVTELVKGGFRAITGAIGKRDPADYEVRTVAATMGIRGTKYSVVWCAGDCTVPPGISTKDPILDGLYIGVSEGTVSITNNTGTYLLHAGEYMYVRDYDTPPERLRQKPVPLIDTFPTAPVEEALAAAELIETLRVRAGTLPQISQPEFPDPPGTDAPNGFPTGPDGPITAVPPRTIESARAPLVAIASGPVPGLTTTAFTASSRDGQRDVAGDDLTVMAVPLGSSSNNNATFAIGTSSIVNSGSDPVTGFRWGRWSGGTANVTLTDGSVINTDLSTQSLHWMYGQPSEMRPPLPITGTANFSVVAGNTDPTDTLGNVGVLGGLSLFADFTAATVENLLVVFIAENEWQAFGTGRITNELFDGLYSVSVNGLGGGTGNFSGFFGAPTANGLPSGAALSYGLNFDLNGSNVSVSGAAVLHPTPPR